MKSELRPISCVSAEELLLASEPADVARLVAGRGHDEELSAHLAGCETCNALASDLASLSSLAGLPKVTAPAALVETTFARAAAESRSLAATRRRALTTAAVKVALVLLLTLPLLAAWNAGVVALGAAYLPELLPESVLFYVGGVYGLAALAGLSALAFTLTLVAGAAVRPPSEELLLEA